MRWLAVFVAVGIAFFSGLHFGSSRTPQKIGICLDLAELSSDEMQDYLLLKDQKQKYDKANEILARIMQIFIADLGLHTAGEQSCKINSTEFPLVVAIAPRPEMPVRQAPSLPASPQEPPPIVAAPRDKKHHAHVHPGLTASGRRAMIATDNALGAVRALYQAILWRSADAKGEVFAADKFSSEGWSAYIRSGQTMIRGSEFMKQVVPNHTPQQIINHIYAVFIGRCAFAGEMKEHLDSLGGDGPAQILSTIILLAKQNQPDQIFAGGFSPASCAGN